MVWWKAAKICRMATEWQHCVWQTLGYHSSVAEDAGLVRCNTVPLDVTPCHWTWHRATGRDTVAPDVTPWHRMWHRATGCDTEPLDVTLCHWMSESCCFKGWHCPQPPHQAIQDWHFELLDPEDDSTMQQVILSQLAAIWPCSDMAANIGEWKSLASTYT